MAYFTRDAYDRKAAYAARKFSENAEIAKRNGMTETEIDAIHLLTSIRHEIHSANRESMYNCNSSDFGKLDKAIEEINIALFDSGLPQITWSFNTDPGDMPSSADYFEIYRVNTNDPMNYSEWFESDEGTFDEFCEIVEKFDSDILKYLLKIDHQYDTNFSPSLIARGQL